LQLIVCHIPEEIRGHAAVDAGPIEWVRLLKYITGAMDPKLLFARNEDLPKVNFVTRKATIIPPRN
jgi:hypothetical protein